MIFSSVTNVMYSQDKKKPTRQSSMAAFSDGNYDVAYREFSELLKIYPKDPLYKYYSGVSLVKLEKDADKAGDILDQAIQGSSVVRTLPDDAIFYLARARHLAGRYAEAVKSYNLYTAQAGKKAAKEHDVPELIQQCINKKGELSEVNGSIPEVKNDTKATIVLPEQKTVQEPLLNTANRKQTSEKEFLPLEYSKILDEALTLQHKADSLSDLAGRQKMEMEKLTPASQSSLKIKISENLKLADYYQKMADQRYNAANSLMNSSEVNQNTVAVKKHNPVINSDSVDKPIIKLKDSVAEPVLNTVNVEDTVINFTLPQKSKQIETYSYFEILPKPVTDASAKIPLDPEIPSGLIYRIQLAVFRNPVTPAFFKGITPVYGVKSPSGVTIYYAGTFRRSADAGKALAEIKAKGFKDSFIVALFDKKSISAERAAILEKVWGKKPFTSIAHTRQEETLDTIPPSLIFRVEALRSLKPLKEDVEEDIKTAAGNRGLDILTLDDGNIAYLIGKFITFTSAAEYADLLIRNGYREARVVAWLGKKEIPVETARQLFENP